MTGVERSGATRWLLAGAIALAVLVMHHLPVAHDAHPGSASASMTSAAPGHAMHAMTAGHTCRMAPTASDEAPMAGMVHDCLAVMGKPTTWLVLLLLVGGACGLAAPWRFGLRTAGRPPDRPPGPGGRATLHSVCVLRL